MAQYRDTVLIFPGRSGLCIQVCEALDESQKAQLEALGLGEAIAVVTPCNPMGRTLETGENTRRLLLMREELLSVGIRYLRADGWSLDGSHLEEGFACAVARVGADALARRWEQEAWWWRNGGLFELRRTV